VSGQSSNILTSIGYDSSTVPVDNEPKIAITNNGKTVINIFEGCNGINIMILFLAFVVAFKGNLRNTLWFIPIGVIFIHLANLGRITMLYWVAQEKPDFMYFTHKYIFTAVIYLAVFFLWTLWGVRFSNLKAETPRG